jgi:hypothetical protein
MKMIRKINFESDYKEVCKWWKHYNYTIIPEPFIPDNTFVYDDGKNILGCIVIYLTDKFIIWVDHLTVSPEVKRPKLKIKIVDDLIEHGRAICRSKGYVIAMGHTSMSGFRKYHSKKGFTVTEPKFSVLMGNL